MENTVKERIKIFLIHLDIGQNTFEERVGWSRAYINNTKHLSADKLKNIFTEYPNLSIEWLLTGKGEMLKDDNMQVSKATPDFLLKRYEELVAEKTRKDDEITALKKEIANLKREKKAKSPSSICG